MSTSTVGQVSAVVTERSPFFLVLERLGRRVLRPGGRRATRSLLDALAIGPGDRVVELGAGVGATASQVLALGPASYVAVEPEAHFVERLDGSLESAGGRAVASRAQETGLPDGSADVVLGEAILTMQAAIRRREIVDEAVRVLRPGGRYGIHELAVMTEDAVQVADLKRDLSRVTRVGASPSPVAHWSELLTTAGLEIRSVETFPFRLLTVRGMLADEGVWRSLAVMARLVSWPEGRKQVRRTRAVYRHYRRTLRAIVVVAEKPGPVSAPPPSAPT